MKRTLLLLIPMMLLISEPVESQKGSVNIIESHGYPNCLEIKNGDTRVVIDPNAGGRVLAYSFKGVDVMHQDASQNGWTTDVSDRPESHLAGGRFDIGPEKLKPNSDLFFFGKWSNEITGNYSVKLTSQLDKNSGLQLTREFILDPNSSRLKVVQTIFNKGDNPIRTAHWSRTFAEGNGICFMPIELPSRFPNKYIVYEQGRVMDFLPAEPDVLVEDGYLVMYAPPTRPKFVMDVSTEGWIGYLTTSNRLFLKTFPVYSDKTYGEMSAANTSIWYNGTEMVEIEPMSPWEWINPGEENSFTENWYLFEYTFPNRRKDFGVRDIKDIQKNKINEINEEAVQ